MDFLSRIKRIVRFVKVTGPANNGESYPTQQITYNGKLAHAYIVMPYGTYANASSSDVLGLCFNVNAADSNKAAIPTIPNKRPRDLAQNEFAVYHPYSEAFIKFRNNGDIEIDTTQKTSGNIIVNTLRAEINASDSAVVKSPAVTIDAAESTFTGNVTIDKNLDVKENATFTSNISSNGKNIGDGHTHDGPATAPSGPIAPTRVVQ